MMVQQQSTAVNLAQHCIKNVGVTCKTGGAYHFEGEDFCDYQKPTKNIYRTPDGIECTYMDCAKILGISPTFTITLFTKHNSDYKYIYENHGKDNHVSKYKDVNGKPSTRKEVAEFYQCDPDRIYKAFQSTDWDFSKAHQKIIKGLKRSKGNK